ncbi:unnamed protein product [Heligmosomoides polygyrus]|uniref:PRELI/MSF1 domain-containing protein n=1 Tax=Heligmosomoides polygyrus TaxID=6339 RepID=A0A183GA36_HELPZ|nr:unnamed protein product [Heligmosomoides polygyrus]
MMTVDKGGNAEQKTVREVVESEWRRFSIDIVPKVLLARGSMVQTLYDSEVAKYAEFKCVDRFLCIRDDSEEKLAYTREEKWIDRAVYITNRSIWTEEKEHVTLLNLFQLDPPSALRLIEEGFEVLTTASLELPMNNAVRVSGADYALDYATSNDEAQRVFSTF